MSIRNSKSTLYIMPSASALAAITGSTELQLVPDVLIPANTLFPGKVLKGTIFGKASCAVTTPGTQTFKIYWGGLAGTVLAASAALTQNVIAQTDDTWMLQFYIQCLTAGALGTVYASGQLVRGNRAAAAVADITPDLLPATGLAAVTIDTTVDKNLTIGFKSSVTTASITAMTYILESMI